MKISNLVADKRKVEVEFPKIDNFLVTLCYIGRDELVKIREHNLTYKFNPATGTREETIDNDTFLKEYAEKVIVGWKGLKVKDLHKLFPADVSAYKPDDEVEFSVDNAHELLENSTLFDQWLTDCMNNVELFNKQEEENQIKN